MAKIYLSSTFEDLKSYRAAVYHTLRQMRHDVVAMEDYVAVDQRPLDKCLADVAECEVYVGIFAHRYGYIPPKDNPQRKSITELEYRKASEMRKERLIFLRDKDSEWPLKFVDAVTKQGENGALIDALREELGGEHCRGVFTSPDDLARQVSVAINEVQQKWTEARLARQRQESFAGSQREAGRAGQRVTGQPVLDVAGQFHGRDAEQGELGRLLQEKSARIVTVLGRAGIGKTALASKVLGGIEQDRWPAATQPLRVDGVVYLSTRTNGVSLERLFLDCADLLPEDARTQLLKAWSSSQISLEDKAERLLKALDQGLYVILLDHLDDVLNAEGQITEPGMRRFLERSLAAPRGARVLVTSRVPLALDAATARFEKQLAITQGLSTDEGVAMLRELDPNGRFGLRDLPQEQLARAVERLHGMPRALEVLAGIKKDKRFRSLDSILDGFYQEELVDELIREGYQRLEPGERQIVDALAVLGRPAPEVAVEFMVCPFCPGLNVDGLLARLTDIYMTTYNPLTSRFSLDAIDQDYALLQLPRQGEYSRSALERRAAEYYARLQTPRELWRTMADVEPYLLEVQHREQAEDFEGAAQALSRIDAGFVVNRGNPEALAAQYARLQGKVRDKKLQALLAAGLGVTRNFLGPLEEAVEWLRLARDLAREVGDKETERQATGWMGDACRRLGRLEEAVTYSREAVRLEESLACARDSFALLLSLALSYRGDFQEAIECCQRLMQSPAISDDLDLQGRVHDGLSLAYLGMGRFQDALEHARQAAKCYEEISARDPLGYVRNVLGMAHLGLGQLPEAQQSFEMARRIGQEDCNPRVEGFGLFNLARL